MNIPSELFETFISFYTNAIIRVSLDLSISSKASQDKNCHCGVAALEIFNLRANAAHSSYFYHQGIKVYHLMTRCLIKLTVFLSLG